MARDWGVSHRFLLQQLSFHQKLRANRSGKEALESRPAQPTPAPATFDNDTNNGSRLEVAYVSTYAGREKRLWWCINPDFFTPPIDNDSFEEW